MPTPGSISADGTFEECIDELNDFVATLERYPPTVLALALRTHLASLLQALLVHGQATRAEIATFVAELEREVHHSGDG